MSLPGIGLVGRKRVGKDTIADRLVEQYGYAKMAFADPVRELVAELNPIIDVEIGITPGFWRKPRVNVLTYRGALLEHGYDRAKELYPEARSFLQRLGTEAGRKVLGEDIWVTALLGRLDLVSVPVVVTDVRFPNEFDALHQRGFLMVRVTRQGLDQGDTHISETALDDHETDVNIWNDYDIDTLHLAVDYLIQGHSIREQWKRRAA